MASPPTKVQKTGEGSKKAQSKGKEKASTKDKGKNKKGQGSARNPPPPPPQVAEITRTGDVPLETGSRADQRNPPTHLPRDDDEDYGEFLGPETKLAFMERNSRTIIPERELDIDTIGCDSVIANILARDWDYLVRKPQDYNVNFVRIFYANAVEDTISDVVMIRDTPVAYDAATINEFYHLPTDIDTELYRQLRNETCYSHLIEALCPRGSEWSQGDRYIHRGEMSREAKIWMYFVSSRLMPTLQTAKTHATRLTLIMAIMKGTPLNVGDIIHAEIKRCIRDTSFGPMFPSLITGLCKLAKVQRHFDDKIVKPPKPIFGFDKLQPASGPDGTGDGPQPDEAGSSSSRPGSSTSRPARPAPKAKKGRTTDASPQFIEHLGEWMDVMEENVGWMKKMMKGMAAILQCRTDDIAEPRPFPPRPRANRADAAASSALVIHDLEEAERGDEDHGEDLAD